MTEGNETKLKITNPTNLWTVQDQKQAANKRESQQKDAKRVFRFSAVPLTLVIIHVSIWQNWIIPNYSCLRHQKGKRASLLPQGEGQNEGLENQGVSLSNPLSPALSRRERGLTEQ